MFYSAAKKTKKYTWAQFKFMVELFLNTLEFFF